MLTTCLWLETDAAEAARLYHRVFGGSEPHIQEGPGGITMATLSIRGQAFMIMSGAQGRIPSEAVSFQVMCQTQDELDAIWDGLIDSRGSALQCGWLQDAHGVYWQVLPVELPGLLSNPQTSQAVMSEFMTMERPVVSRLLAAGHVE